VKQDILYPELDTPAILVDMDKLEANINEAQALVNSAGVKFRTVSKCHESAEIVRMQIKAGAVGVSVGKLEEALHMADQGIRGILILHPFYGDQKMKKLKELIEKPKADLHACVVDMIEQAEAISQVGQASSKRIPILLKIDTGVKRFGVLPGEPALKLAKEIVKLPGIELKGIISHESPAGLIANTKEGLLKLAHEVAAVMSATARLLKSNGIPIEHVEIGSTPTLSTIPILKGYPEITEIHAGEYAYGDIAFVTQLAMPMERCALFVLTTVVSIPDSVPARAIIDAGSKTIPPMPMHPKFKQGEPGFLFDGKPSYGQIVGRPDLWLGRLSIVNSVVYFTDPNKRVFLGERLVIIPNAGFICIGIHKKIFGVRNGKVEKILKDIDTGSF